MAFRTRRARASPGWPLRNGEAGNGRGGRGVRRASPFWPLRNGGREDGEKREAAVPLAGLARSLWGIRPISEKEQSLPGKRACGPFPIQALFLF